MKTRRNKKATVFLVVMCMVVCIFACQAVAFADGEAGASVTPELNSLRVKPDTGSAVTMTVSDNMSVALNAAEVTFIATVPADCTAEIDGTAIAEASVFLYDGKNNVEIVVYETAAPGNSKTYNLEILKANDKIDSIVIKNGSSVIFDDYTTSKAEYSIKVASTVEQLSIEVSPNSKDAVCEFNNTVDNGTILLNSPGTTTRVRVRVRAYDGASTYNEVVINIERLSDNASSDATLSDLDVLNGSTSLMSSFSATQTSYTLTVPASSSVNFKPTANDSKATITVAGTTVASGKTTSVATPASGSSKTVSVVVTAEDMKTTKTYSVVLQGDGSGSTDRTLSALTLKVGSTNYKLSPTFTSGTTTYSVTIPSTASSYTVAATAKASTSQVAITTSSSSPLTASTSYSSTASRSITAPDKGSSEYVYAHVRSGSGTSQYYRIKVTRSTSSSTNDTLSKLLVKSGSTTYSLFPTFNKSTSTYYVCVPNGISSVRVTPTATDSSSTITVAGDEVSSGSQSDSISVKTSSSTRITIRVTSASGTSTENYYVNVYRAKETNDNDYDTDKLLWRAGKTSSSMSSTTFSPSFSNSTSSYKLYMDSSDKYMSLRWEEGSSNSLAFLTDDEGTITTLTSDSYCDPIKVSDGDKLTLRVYSPDYTRYKDYTFTCNDSGRDTGENGDDDESSLSRLVVRVDGSTGTLSPSFTAKTTGYTVRVADTASYVSVTPTASDSDATITVNGTKVNSGSTSSNLYFSGSSKTLTALVVVTAEDGKTKTTYSVTFQKGTTTSTTTDEMKLVLKLNSTRYYLNGSYGTLLASPYASAGRTMVPIRVISESLGATVNYNGSTKVITISQGSKTLTMKLGQAITGGYGTPVVRNSTTFVPVRYVSEQLGAKVDWISSTSEVVITK